MVDDATHAADQAKFDETEALDDGLGPLYNAQSCRECHQNPTSGGPSQVTELRVGHAGPRGEFVNPEIPIARGTEIIKGRSLVNDRAICPNAAFSRHGNSGARPGFGNDPNFPRIAERFGRWISSKPSRIRLSWTSPKTSARRITKSVARSSTFPSLSPGQTRVGRFGWKDQQASSFPSPRTPISMKWASPAASSPTKSPTSATRLRSRMTRPAPTSLRYRPLRALHPCHGNSARDAQIAQTPKARLGAELFDKVGCDTCHVQTLTNSSRRHKPQRRHVHRPARSRRKAVSSLRRLPASQCRHRRRHRSVHDEHYGKKMYQITWKNLSISEFNNTANKIRTAPLWVSACIRV